MTTEDVIPEVHRAILGAAVNAVPSAWTRRSHAPLPDLQRAVKLRIEIDGTSYLVAVEVLPAEPNWQAGAVPVPEQVTRPRPALKLLEDAFCRSPIAGRIIKVFAAIGDPIAKNQPVLIVEAMKMEVEISAAVDGVVKAIHVKPGQSVSTGQLLFELT
jgi:biotin carboxyl carrier protein